jgi:hypothetical protein
VSNPNGALPTSATASQGHHKFSARIPYQSCRNGGQLHTVRSVLCQFDDVVCCDEGTGTSTDLSTNDGLEKWSLIGGTWQLGYTLKNNLIGQSYTVNGWPTVTTIGLRILTGEVNADGTVTLFATTSATSASG